tara:strand:+ start:179 stop:352 length:174 start_codon:yes stop_codon:yes gene_type:complete
MNINLQKEELNFILNVLGELPSKTGAWPLIVSLKDQAESQVNDTDTQTDNVSTLQAG